MNYWITESIDWVQFDPSLLETWLRCWWRSLRPLKFWDGNPVPWTPRRFEVGMMAFCLDHCADPCGRPQYPSTVDVLEFDDNGFVAIVDEHFYPAEPVKMVDPTKLDDHDPHGYWTPPY